MAGAVAAERADKGSVSDNISEEERASIDKALEDANEWLDVHQDADKEALDEKLEELKTVVGPIMTLAYGAGMKDPGKTTSPDDDLDSYDEL